MKDAQCAETKDELKKSYHIISCFRVLMGDQKGRYQRPKIEFSSREVKLAEKIRIVLKMVFHINSYFCATLSF